MVPKKQNWICAQETLRRTIQALAEGRDPADLTTIEDPGALDQIRRALKFL